MKPLSYKVKPNSNFLSGNFNINFGIDNTVKKIQGIVNEKTTPYDKTIVALYDKYTMDLVALRKPDIQGFYKFSGIHSSTQFFIIAFDLNHKFNAIIQDNVIPK